MLKRAVPRLETMANEIRGLDSKDSENVKEMRCALGRGKHLIQQLERRVAN